MARHRSRLRDDAGDADGEARASATANLALIGDELVQFAVAEQTGPRLFRLSGLLRGRRGSEGATASHVAGERFVLIDAEALAAWPVPAGAIGTTIRIAASGTGDATPAEAAIPFQARALRPLCPVALHAAAGADGRLAIGWTRRSRQGWVWLDGIDAPLGEEREAYRLVAARAGGGSVAIETASPEAILDPASVDGTGPLTLIVAQIGTSGASLPPATLTLA